jgi:antitoxin component YwqK of YwqJK toxin-antitoxin module
MSDTIHREAYNPDPKHIDMIGEKDVEIEQYVTFENGIDAYKFYKNKSLRYRGSRDQNGEMIGEQVYFHENGKVKQKSLYEKGIKNGYFYHFYESGILEGSWQYKNDSAFGYCVDYYNKVGAIKSDYLFLEHEKWICKRLFDSITGKIIKIEDYRPIYLKEYPSVDPQTLKMPGE